MKDILVWSYQLNEWKYKQRRSGRHNPYELLLWANHKVFFHYAYNRWVKV